jgi:hypothetical protein
VDLTSVGLYTVALLLYPGALVACLPGALAEFGAGLALARGVQPLREVGVNLTRLHITRAVPPRVSGSVLLTLMAATQLGAPFNPVPATERNVLVAAAALAGAVWLAWPGSPARRQIDGPLLLAVQAGWLAALLAPIVATGRLSPDAIGAAAIGPLIPVKVAAGALYVLCLPGLLGLTSHRAGPGDGGAGGRLLLWLPLCGLFASVFFPPGPDDVLGLARFAAATLLGVVLAIVLAAALARSPGAVRNAYVVAVFSLAAATLLAGAITAVLLS